MPGSRFHNTRSSVFRRRLRHESLETRVLFTVTMTPEDQLLLELVNRARADPLAEIERNVIADRRDSDLTESDIVTDLNADVEEDELISDEPKQPLAPHQSLIDAMHGHLEDMLARDYFGHDSPEGSSPSSRARREGYPAGAGENIAWSGRAGRGQQLERVEEVYKRHRGLVRSVGHRINMMRENWREIGPGVEYGQYRENLTVYDSIMVGTLFGNRRGDNFITGVAITDHVSRNNFYEIGEGMGNVLITATQEGTDNSYSVVTGPTGGYALQVPDGTYIVTASGGNLSRELMVRSIVVDGENVKVDFNNAGMTTRFISGRIFEDTNSNRQHDGNERALSQHTVFVDLNDDNQLGEGEPRVRSDSRGNYRIDGLLPGEYTIRQVLLKDWVETVPFGSYVVPLNSQNIIGVNFGSVLHNENPVAEDDASSVIAGRSVTIDVLENDSDAEGEMDPSTLRVSRIPRYGTVTVSNGSFIYEARSDFSGTDTFSYTVDDQRAGRSNAANVTIDVSPSLPFQNADDPYDVDGNGFVASLDVLIVVNELNRGGARSLANQTRNDALPHFYDVSGDEFVSSLDALRIIQFINRRTRAASGEPPEREAVASVATPSPTSSVQQQDLVFALFGAGISEERKDDSFVD